MNLTKRTYYVVNNNGDLACHDNTYLNARDVLNDILSKDPNNHDGWELCDADDVE